MAGEQVPVDFFRTEGIRVRVGHTVVPPTSELLAAVDAAIGAYNVQARLEGLDDDLNPWMVDEMRARRFLATLPQASSSVREQLHGGTIYLNALVESLGMASPYVAPQADRETLTISRVGPDRLVHLSLKLSVDAQRATQIAHAARLAVESLTNKVDDAQNAVQSASNRGQAMESMNRAKRARGGAATAWQKAAQALADATPGDRALRRDAELAEKAATRYRMTPATGMPM
jgi:hypothetical protein